MASRSLQQSLPPMEVKRLDGENISRPQNGLPRELPAISLQMAKAQIGGALRTTIHRTGASLKEFGDPSRVNRVCDGEIPEALARAWQAEDRRKEFVLALAEASGCFDIHTSINTKRSA
jgi:hypothetical protein